MLLNLVTPLHEQTKRDYKERLLDNKVEAMVEARKFEENYWDGPRRYGYGGYKYDGRWAAVAQRLVDRYGLDSSSSVLDIGCGKGFLLYEIQKLVPGIYLEGIERSQYAIANKHPDLQATIINGRAENITYAGNFTLALSLGTFHNLTLRDLHQALPTIQNAARHKYIMVESFRDEREWFNLTAWCLTAETLMRPEDWEFLFKQTGYTGDWEFIFFR